MKIKIYIIIVVMLFDVCYVIAQSGGQPEAFMRRELGSAALAMGGAYTSIANDGSAAFWNPAGLTQIQKREFLGMYSVLSFDRQNMFASFAWNFPKIISLGAAWLKYGVTNIDGRDILGNATGIFNDDENCILLSCGKQFGILSLGLTGKYLFHKLYYNTANGYSFDFGLLLNINKIFKFGMVVQDGYGELKWKSESNLKEKIPMSFRAGFSYQPLKIPIIVAVDVSKVGLKKDDGNFYIKGGFEYCWQNMLGIRGGYNGFDPTFGGFIRIGKSKSMITEIDYAGTMDKLQDAFVHHITLRLIF
jgi:hypothetical protein